MNEVLNLMKNSIEGMKLPESNDKAPSKELNGRLALIDGIAGRSLLRLQRTLIKVVICYF